MIKALLRLLCSFARSSSALGDPWTSETANWAGGGDSTSLLTLEVLLPPASDLTLRSSTFSLLLLFKILFLERSRVFSSLVPCNILPFAVFLSDGYGSGMGIGTGTGIGIMQGKGRIRVAGGRNGGVGGLAC